MSHPKSLDIPDFFALLDNENTVDGSPDAVSVYAAAMGLIRAEERNQRMLEQEFENGASRIIASADMLSRTPDGKQALTDTLFVGLDDDPSAVGVTVFSPALREASYLARKQDILRSTETLIGLKRGILSEVEATERTATEITSSAGDYNLTILDFQAEWTKAIRELMQICAALGAWYGLCQGGTFAPEDIVLDYGDGVLYNREKTWQELHHRNSLADGAKNSELNTLDKYEDAKYNNSPAYRMLSGYTRAVEKGDISPLVGLETYQQVADDVRTQIVGQTTATGLRIEIFATHFVDRVIGQTSTPHTGMRRGVPIADALDALQNPVKTGAVRHLQDGDIRQTFVGKTADVTVSIRDKRLLQTNPNG